MDINNASDITNTSSNPVINSDEKNTEELEKEMQETLDNAVQSNKEFEEKNGPMLKEIENEPEISEEDDSQDDAEAENLEKEIGEDLDKAMVDLSTKEEDEDKE